MNLSRYNTSIAAQTAPFSVTGVSIGHAGWLNLGLAIVAVVTLMYYVMQVNVLAASAWQLKDARERLATLREDRDALIAQGAELDDRPVLEALARNSGFVPADTVVYLVEPSAVAAVR
jgi:cell division protein FtsB